MLRLTHALVILLCSKLVFGDGYQTIETPPLVNDLVLQFLTHRTLFLAFPVNASEFRLFIDPQLILYEPFSNGTAYILLSMSNTSVPNIPSFVEAELSTVIVHQGQVHKTTLHNHFSALVPALTGSLYSQIPYGSTFTEHMSESFNQTVPTYQFDIDDGVTQLHAEISWDPNEDIEVDNNQTTL